MTESPSSLHHLFDCLQDRPSDLVAFERYAKAVEDALDGPESQPPAEIARILERHLERLPVLVESRLETGFEDLSKRLEASLDLEEVRTARAFHQALEAAREQLEASHPRVGDLSPEEFVTSQRQSPERLFEFLQTHPDTWFAQSAAKLTEKLRLCQEFPGDAAGWRSLAQGLARAAEKIQNEPPRAHHEVALRLALTFDPGEPIARTGLGRLAHHHGRWEEARLEYQAALDRDPGFEPARLGLLRLALDSGRLEEAEQGFQELERMDPGSRKLPLLRGLLELAQGRVVGALEWLHQAIDLDPDNPAAYQALERAYLFAGKEELSQLYREASRIRGAPDLDDEGPALQSTEPLPLSEELRRRPPSPPRVHELRPLEEGSAPAGPLTRREAFRSLFEASWDGADLGPEGMGMVLRLKEALRISREVYQEIRLGLEESSPRKRHGSEAFDPIEFFEGLRRRAWSDGQLTAPERDILETVVSILGIDRRTQPRS